jgi:hypothetical protein
VGARARPGIPGTGGDTRGPNDSYARAMQLLDNHAIPGFA